MPKRNVVWMQRCHGGPFETVEQVALTDFPYLYSLYAGGRSVGQTGVSKRASEVIQALGNFKPLRHIPCDVCGKPANSIAIAYYLEDPRSKEIDGFSCGSCYSAIGSSIDFIQLGYLGTYELKKMLYPRWGPLREKRRRPADFIDRLHEKLAWSAGLDKSVFALTDKEAYDFVESLRNPKPVQLRLF